MQFLAKIILSCSDVRKYESSAVKYNSYCFYRGKEHHLQVLRIVLNSNKTSVLQIKQQCSFLQLEWVLPILVTYSVKFILLSLCVIHIQYILFRPKICAWSLRNYPKCGLWGQLLLDENLCPGRLKGYCIFFIQTFSFFCSCSSEKPTNDWTPDQPLIYLGWSPEGLGLLANIKWSFLSTEFAQKSEAGFLNTHLFEMFIFNLMLLPGDCQSSRPPSSVTQLRASPNPEPLWSLSALSSY